MISPNITNGMMVVEINHIKPEMLEPWLVHGLTIGVVVGAPELEEEHNNPASNNRSLKPAVHSKLNSQALDLHTGLGCSISCSSYPHDSKKYSK